MIRWWMTRFAVFGLLLGNAQLVRVSPLPCWFGSWACRGAEFSAGNLFLLCVIQPCDTLSDVLFFGLTKDYCDSIELCWQFSEGVSESLNSPAL